MLASVALPATYCAAVLLLGRTVAEQHALSWPSTSVILETTGASRSQAYEVERRLAEVLPTLVRGPGRPAKPEPAPVDTGAITREVLAHVMSHPGCVNRGAERQRYTDGFRRFVLEVRHRHPTIELDAFADAVGIPVPTLKDWLREPRVDAPVATSPAAPTTATADLEVLHIQTVLDAWRRWEGSFLDFCEHVQRHLGVPFGRSLVSRILETHGLRRRASRDGRSPDELALRGAFQTYFPGAQWVGDGMQVPVTIDGERFVLNLELNVDAYSGAFVGASVRATEDAVSVTEAFQDGVATTGAPPLALLLDNKPSNHLPAVDAVLGDTIRIRATLERPQNKAHVEGAFGLFSRALPPLELDTRGAARDIAGRLLTLAFTTWARTMNWRPRTDRNGGSRVDLYSESPTDEQLERAKRDLRELVERQERARRTLEARRRPEVLALLDSEFARLALIDPERHIRIAIARYPFDAILAGLSIFDAKTHVKTLPDGADARYLLGIVKNVTAKTEGEYFAEAIYEARIRARDHFLAAYRQQREALRSEPDVLRVLAKCVENAMLAQGPLGRNFWLDAVVETLREEADDKERKRLYVHATRLVESYFDAAVIERHAAVRYIAEHLILLA